MRTRCLLLFSYRSFSASRSLLKPPSRSLNSLLRRQCNSSAAVPPMIKFRGTMPNTPSGTAGVTFALYGGPKGGAPLWLETQNVTVDEQGNYTVYLGANHAGGVPSDLFTSGNARWLGVQPHGHAEQERTLLVSVPYALEAGDAQTLGGKPLSAFVLSPDTVTTGATSNPSATSNPNPSTSTSTATAAVANGNTNYLAKFTANGRYLVNSILFDTGSGVGIGTPAPGQKLEVNGSIKLSAGSGGGVIFADGTVLTSAQGATGPQGPTGATGPPGATPGHVALLQWWSSVAYSVGNSPQGVAFDGANIWVTNAGTNNVTKLLASSGAVVGTYPVGSFPDCVAFDGTNIWVTTQNDNGVSKIPAF